MKIGIVGVGLLGGSLAVALKNKFGSGISLFAFSSPRTLEKASSLGIFSGCADYEQLTQVCISQQLDFVFLCTPIKVIEAHLAAIAKASYPNRLVVTDIGSTKGQLMDTAGKLLGGREDVHFIGGHPMTGNEFSGIDAADPLLYENAIYVLTPTKQTPNDLLNTYIDLVKGIGAIPLIMEAHKHDKIVAGISHLPQMMATGLVDLISKQEHAELHKMLSAGGFRDMTRIASSQYRMWEDIIDTNKHNIELLVDKYIEELHTIKYALHSGGLDKIFQNAKDTREAIPKSKHGLLMPHFEIMVSVRDEPGTLLRISTILAEKGINIKDIRVQNSRELQGGHFLLGFGTEENRQQAAKLLIEEGYNVLDLD
jgi:prephenate dehydrogenase